jgi:hypothetical protein
MAMADRFGLPLAACAASATPHEVTLVAATRDSRFVDALPRRLIGDRAYDADPLDAALAQVGVELIAPIAEAANAPRRRMSARCVGIGAGGRSSGSSPGWATSASWSCATSVMRSITLALCTSAASSTCSARREDRQEG